jgi:Trk K+ transport system NAD-binding subunit
MSSLDERRRSVETAPKVDHHIILSGDDALANAILTELESVGATVIRLADDDVADTEIDLAEAGIDQAAAIVCAGEDVATNLEIALLAREANPDVRVVARLASEVLRQALGADNGPGAILDVADLAAPSVVEACLADAAHPFAVAGVDFLVSGNQVPRDATLRELYGDLDPVAVLRGKDSPTPGRLVVCPGRDLEVHAGDWASMIGTTEESAACGVTISRAIGPHARRSRLRGLFDAARALRDDVNPAFYPVMAALLALVIGSTALLHFSYRPQSQMTWVDSLYFTIETVTTTGYGDFSFAGQTTWLRLYAALLMFGGVLNIALLVSFVADVLLSRRFVRAGGRRRVSHLRNHVIVVGLGTLGFRVVTDLAAAGYDVAVIEIDEDNRFLPAVAELDVPVIFGDATMLQTLESAGVDRARGVAVLTRDEVVNVETGIVLAAMLGRQLLPEVIRPDVPLVLRVYDRALGFALARRFGFVNVRSTVELAVPWFISAALGWQVLATFSVGQSSFVVGAMQVEPASDADGKKLSELSAQIRVIAITRLGEPVNLHPRRDARLSGGDTVYLVGPYHELLNTLREGLSPQRPAGSDVRLGDD